ncbi:MAG: DUF4388 domain-containing protein [Cyanobacteria bacterium]|nr:DUF4388 domain-containing protein [Cyanobacteriota bacterium]
MQLSGELSKVNLPNLLQLVKTGGLTGKITIVQGARVFVVFVDDGSPVHVDSEAMDGLDALMELFLWSHGTFSFEEEEDSANFPRTIDPDDPNCSLERLLKEGIEYARKKRFLDDQGITPRSILIPTGHAISFAREVMAMPGLERLDGRRTLREALGDMNLSKIQFVSTVASWLADGLAEVIVKYADETVDQVDLPAWVVARLKQDNPDISQAIIDMVIWVDRVKCWMYQVDADFYRIRKNMEKAISESNSADGTFDDDEEQVDPASVFSAPRPPTDLVRNPYIDAGQSMSFAPYFGIQGTTSFLSGLANVPLETKIDLDWTTHSPAPDDDEDLL